MYYPSVPGVLVNSERNSGTLVAERDIVLLVDSGRGTSRLGGGESHRNYLARCRLTEMKWRGADSGVLFRLTRF